MGRVFLKKQYFGAVWIKEIDNAMKSGSFGVLIGDKSACGCDLGTVTARATIDYAQVVQSSCQRPEQNTY